jgi:DNA mismatch repair protein MutS
MMLQWQECKKKAKDALLLFRLGDFYEAFENDAQVIAKELELVLTKRQETPMAGVPAHTCEAYIDKLVGRGYSVAIAEQMEDPKAVKGIVRRDVVRVVTPGTVINSNLLTEKSSNFLVAIAKLNTRYGVAILDLTTADFRVMEGEDEIVDELARLQPKEVLTSHKVKLDLASFCVQRREEWFFDHRVAMERLLKHFQVKSLDGFGMKGMTAAVSAAGALFAYVTEDLHLSLSHIKEMRLENSARYMAIDRTTQRHLELDSLLALVDTTATPMGGRLLKEWLLHPLISVEEIQKRQDNVAILMNAPILHSKLKEVRDLQRLIMRIETGYATPRDLVGLRFSLEPFPEINAILKNLGLETLPDLSTLAAKISAAVVETPPLRLSDGGIIKEKYHPELDELRALKKDSHTWMVQYQTELREKTQIKTLKVGYTQAFGYYIEVSRGQSDKMPLTFQRRQTLVNAERFISPELKEFEHKVLTAEARIAALESELFHQLRLEIALHAERVRSAAKILAEIDVLLALATLAQSRNYVRPVVDHSDVIDIHEGRHPVIEAALKETFIPNDALLDQNQNRLLIITGPNMAGKSTFIRQVALICILAQVGSFVPAKSAHIGIIDKVFSRIGASDDLTRGQSTFMVEMTETANILNNATSRSFVILDEIGRGTSTYDGISIAWAVAEYLLEKRIKTLFATHYWELTKLPQAANFNVAVHESEKGIVFLRKIVPGGTDKSYGIHVAKLAGLPPSVIGRATHLLAELHATAAEPISLAETQLELF